MRGKAVGCQLAPSSHTHRSLSYQVVMVEYPCVPLFLNDISPPSAATRPPRSPAAQCHEATPTSRISKSGSSPAGARLNHHLTNTSLGAYRSHLQNLTPHLSTQGVQHLPPSQPVHGGLTFLVLPLTQQAIYHHQDDEPKRIIAPTTPQALNPP